MMVNIVTLQQHHCPLYSCIYKQGMVAMVKSGHKKYKNLLVLTRCPYDIVYGKKKMHN